MVHLDIEDGCGADQSHKPSTYDEKSAQEYFESPREPEQPQARSSRVMKILFHALIITCLLTWIGGCLSTGLKKHHTFSSKEVEQIVDEIAEITTSRLSEVEIEAEIESKLSWALNKRQDDGNATTPPSPNSELESTTSLEESSVTSSSDPADTSSGQVETPASTTTEVPPETTTEAPESTSEPPPETTTTEPPPETSNPPEPSTTSTTSEPSTTAEPETTSSGTLATLESTTSSSTTSPPTSSPTPSPTSSPPITTTSSVSTTTTDDVTITTTSSTKLTSTESTTSTTSTTTKDDDDDTSAIDDGTVTTLEPTSSPVRTTFVSVVDGGGSTMTMTSTAWVEVTPTSAETDSSNEPDLQNAAPGIPRVFALTTGISVAIGVFLML